MNPTRDRVLVFDVNETLLDLGALDPHFARVFGDPAVRREWFATMLQSALLLTVTGPYFDFGSHFRAALALTAERPGVTVSAADAQAILGAAAAFVARPGALWNPLLEKPDVWGKDLREVADQIIARDD